MMHRIRRRIWLRRAIVLIALVVIAAQGIIIALLAGKEPVQQATRLDAFGDRVIQNVTALCTIDGKSPSQRLEEKLATLAQLGERLERCPDVLKATLASTKEIEGLGTTTANLSTAVAANTVAASEARDAARTVEQRLPKAEQRWFEATTAAMDRLEGAFKCPEGGTGPDGVVCSGNASSVRVGDSLLRMHRVSESNYDRTQKQLTEVDTRVKALVADVKREVLPVVESLEKVSAASAVIQKGVRDYAVAASADAKVTLKRREISISLSEPGVLSCADFDVGFGVYDSAPEWERTLMMPSDFYEEVVLNGQSELSREYIRLAVRVPLDARKQANGTTRCEATIPIGESAYQFFSKSKRGVQVEMLIAPEKNVFAATMKLE